MTEPVTLQLLQPILPRLSTNLLKKPLVPQVLALTAAFCFRQTFCEDSSPSDRNEIVGESVEANLSTSLRLLQELEEVAWSSHVVEIH